MSVFQFGQVSIASKEFYKHKQITDLNTIDYDRIVVSDVVSCNNGKDKRYIVGYQVDSQIIPLYIKTPKKVFSYGVSQYNANAAHTMSFNVDDHKEWAEKYEKLWEAVECQIFENLSTKPVREGKYINAKLKTWKDQITTNFHGQIIPHGMYCNATAVLKIGSVYNQGRNYYPQVFVEECKFQESQQQHCTLLVSDSEDEEDLPYYC